MLLKRIFNFYIDASIHVALSATALAWITLLEYRLPFNNIILFFIGFATVTAYNFVKYYGVAKWHFRHLATNLKVIQVFSAASFLILLYFMTELHSNTLLLCGVFGVVTFLYAIPIFSNFFNLNNLRQINGLKIYVVAFVWSGVTVVLPIINAESDLNYSIGVMAIQRFIYIIVLMIPFEIRDLQYDSLKLETFPQKMGVKHTKYLGISLLVVFFVLEFFKLNVETAQVLKVFIIAVSTGVFLLFSKVQQSKYYASFWVESLPLIWLITSLVL